MLQCGTLGDVYSYEKMKHQRGNESPQSARLSSKKIMSFRESSGEQSPISAKLGGKKTSSFRRIFGQNDNALGSSKRVVVQDAKETTLSSRPPKKVKDPSKRIGFVDILLGYHSLLQASPAYPLARQRKELHPTIGFIRNPD